MLRFTRPSSKEPAVCVYLDRNFWGVAPPRRGAPTPRRGRVDDAAEGSRRRRGEVASVDAVTTAVGVTAHGELNSTNAKTKPRGIVDR